MERSCDCCGQMLQTATCVFCFSLFSVNTHTVPYHESYVTPPRCLRPNLTLSPQELETRCVQLESRDTQYRASIRKKEVEYGRLQDSLRRSVDKGSSTMMPRGAGGKGSAKGRYIRPRTTLCRGCCCGFVVALTDASHGTAVVLSHTSAILSPQKHTARERAAG